MNMISTGSFLTETGASNKQSELVKKLTAAWEKKNSKTARAGGASLMALSLAACGGEDTTPFAQSDVDAAVAAAEAPLQEAVAAAEAAQAAAEADAAEALVAQAAAEADAAAALVAQAAAEADAAAATVAAAEATAAKEAAETAQAAAEASLATAQADLTAKTAEYDALVASNATLQGQYDALVAPQLLSFVSTSAETLNGGAGDDTFTVSGANYGTGDKIRDTSSTDNDTANYTLTAGNTPDITGVENVNVTINNVGTATLTASSMGGVNVLTVTRGDVVVGGSTIAGNKAIDIDAANASEISTIVIGGTATTVAVDQATRAGMTIDADAATGNVNILGAANVSAMGAGTGDTVTVTSVDAGAGTFTATEATENAKAVTVTTNAETVAIANDDATDVFDGVITVTGAATKNVTIANATGGGSINVLGETGTLGADGIDVVDVDDSGFSVTTSYVGTSTAAGVIDIDGTATANQVDVATVSANGIQNIRLAAVETVNLSGNTQAVTFDVNAASDVTTYAASGSNAVTLRGDLTEFDGATITGVTTLDIDGGTAATIDLGKMDATTAVDLGVNNAGNAITVQSGTGVTVTSDQTTDLEFSFKTGSTAFDLSVTAGDDNGTSTAVGTIDVTSFLVNGSATVAGTVNLDATVANFNAATSTNVGAKTNLVITGDEDVTLGTVTADSVNASASTGIIDMTATTGVDSITTGAGADQIVLNDASTTHSVDAGAGNDQVTITATNDGALIAGGAGNDLIIASETVQAYVVNGGDGNDTVRIGDVNATLVGGAGDDILDVNASLDLTDAAANANGLLAISSFETIDMEETGQQVLQMRANTFAGNNTFALNVDDATDTLTVTAAATGSVIDASGVTLASGDTAAIINLTGGAGNDTITGGVVGENFAQTRGSDSIEGGSTGTDTLTLIASGATVGSTGTTTTGSVINLGSTAVSAAAVVASTSNHLSGGLIEVATGKAGYLFSASSALNSADLDTISGIENITGGDGVDYIVGSAGNNTIDGAGSADYIDGGDGDDILTGGTGADILDGGLGDDTINAENTDTNIDGGGGTDTVAIAADADFSGDTFSNVEKATLADDADLTLDNADLEAMTHLTGATGGNDENIVGVGTASAETVDLSDTTFTDITLVTVDLDAGADTITVGTVATTMTLGGSDSAADTVVLSTTSGLATITEFEAGAGADVINIDALTSETATTTLTGNITLEAAHVYFASGAFNDDMSDVDAAVLTDINGAATITEADVVAYIIAVDTTTDNMALFEYDYVAGASIAANELTLLAKSNGEFLASDFAFA